MKRAKEKIYFFKRVFDASLSVVLFIIFVPLFLTVALLVKLTSKGPIFFQQKRCGLGMKEFKMYKFRTMVKNAESLKNQLQNEMDGPVFKVKCDPRITRVGKVLRKWSIDELPQLINVMRGEMSLVGPRPLSLEELGADEKWKEIRSSVKPGMTGLWQVKGRASEKFSDWVKYDIEYVSRQSIFFDIKILFTTIFAVLRRNGAY